MTADAASLTHFDARSRWGLPDTQEGSVNDPRTREENGVRFNERWVYRLEDGSLRIVYWHRYNCRGVLRQAPDGSARPEPV